MSKEMAFDGNTFIPRLLWTAMYRAITSALVLWFLAMSTPVVAQAPSSLVQRIEHLSHSHASMTGIWVLEKGEDALLARAWLGQEAVASIDVQYFIWSNDNIGTLAAEALLSAAERGVRVRVLVDDFLIDAPEGFLVALDSHPNIEIRIYNPVHSVGVSSVRRLWHLVSGFWSANQRMHDKAFIVDQAAAIIGGRNMADEYFDYDQAYNFRDRDLLLLGPEVSSISAHFQRFWESREARAVSELLADTVRLSTEERHTVYADLHDYAASLDNFAPEVRQTIASLPASIDALLPHLTWLTPHFLHDLPGKSSPAASDTAEAMITPALHAAIATAKQEILIQSPYLVLTEQAFRLLADKIRQGVKVRISTNSLPASDNLAAYSGYASKRKRLLQAGFEIREFRPDAPVRTRLRDGFAALRKGPTVFAIHAKTLIIDRRHLFIGTFNLDPRSMYLNTEIAVHLDHRGLAQQVATAIETDMSEENSYDPRRDNAHDHVAWNTRLKLLLLRLLPLEPIL